jgi:glutathione S-transferase
VVAHAAKTDDCRSMTTSRKPNSIGASKTIYAAAPQGPEIILRNGPEGRWGVMSTVLPRRCAAGKMGRRIRRGGAMKLYYSPGACSLAPHIVLEELGLAAEKIPVDLKNKTYAGGNYLQVNPKGAVPALQADNGELLTENAVILQYLADQKPDAGLLPAWGTFERYRALELLNFIATEVHKGFGPLWDASAPDAAKTKAKELLAKRFGYLEERLRGKQFLLGDKLMVPDAYLFVTLGWTRFHKLDMANFPELMKYAERVQQRPAVAAAMRAEGLLK